MMCNIGYARVSTSEQSVDLQLLALQRASCDKIFKDCGISGTVVERPGLNEALEALQPGDKLVVWRLDRLGRSLIHLVGLLNQLAQREIQFQSLTENIDTTSAGGKLIFHMMAALAEFERSMISERTRAGLAAVQEKGIHVGRPHLLSDEQRRKIAKLLLERKHTTSDIAKMYNVHPRTISRAMQSFEEGTG